jgi:hypothetical protein
VESKPRNSAICPVSQLVKSICPFSNGDTPTLACSTDYCIAHPTVCVEQREAGCSRNRRLATFAPPTASCRVTIRPVVRRRVGGKWDVEVAKRPRSPRRSPRDWNWAALLTSV